MRGRGSIHGAFYGPVNRGQLNRAIAAIERNPQRRARLDAMIDEVLAGSNVIRGATDQGSGRDPNVRWPGGRIVRRGEVFNDWGGGPGGHAGARRYREEQQRRAAEAERRSRLDDAIAVQSGRQTVEGDGHITVDVNAPRGTRSRVRGGGMFHRTRLNRSSQMDHADPDGETRPIPRPGPGEDQ